jgi:RNA polymerase sigma-70 factor (ECF subfamily)
LASRPRAKADVKTSVDLYIESEQRQPLTMPSVIPASDENVLVGAARDGDRTAFGQLYERFARMVHGILLARVPRSEVDDLVQDVFLQALRRLHTLRDSAAFGPWLAMITRNRANDFYRRSKEASEELSEDLAATESDRTEALAILSVIRSLPDAYRETMVLRLVEGMTGPEIAARTGLKAASVRVNLHRGMKQLREKLESRRQ